MDLKEAIRDVAKRSRVTRDTAETEEATKNGVIMPFIRALGFDVFDLSQVIPEFTADVGVKKGEKVDYALKIDGKLVMLVEAKPISMDLGNAQYSQLYRYFGVTDAKIAILTNGAQVWFFSDIDETNRMDKRPFFVFDFESYDDEDVKELSKFHKDTFSVDGIMETAAMLKYSNAAVKFLGEQFSDPDDDFVRLVARQIYDGNITKNVIDQMRTPVKAALSGVVRERLQARLNVAFSDPEPATKIENSKEASKETEIETTEDEWKAFYIVQAIAAEVVEPRSIHIRDAKSYCSILFDNNNRKPICRLYFNAKSVMYIGIFDASKAETRHTIETPRDIYRFKDDLKSVIQSYTS